MSLEQENRVLILKERAHMLKAARAFFYERNLVEVDVPILSKRASIDAHIDLFQVALPGEKRAYLHTSPEYGMKRLLGRGMGPIFQLSHVFREGEYGTRHNPEFMMAEWYQPGYSFDQIIEETLDFIALFLGNLPRKRSSYRALFLEFLGVDILSLTKEELLVLAEKEGVSLYSGIESEGRDGLLTRILNEKIEPLLGHDELFVISHFPATQAALAKKVTLDGFEAAERFEVYFQGIELANGYHELTDPHEQRARLEEANQARIKMGKEAYPLDELFLEALNKGIPDSCGVAVGFDRLMMLRTKKASLKEVIPFDFESA